MIATLADIHGVSANQHRLVSIYPARTVPITPAEDDPLAVEVGVQFSVSQPGSVVGVRYYKSVQNRGTHVGSLWSESGVRLAAATFTRVASIPYLSSRSLSRSLRTLQCTTRGASRSRTSFSEA